MYEGKKTLLEIVLGSSSHSFLFMIVLHLVVHGDRGTGNPVSRVGGLVDERVV